MLLGKKGVSEFIMLFVALAFIFSGFLIYSALNNPLWSSFEQLLIILTAIVLLFSSLVAMIKG